MKRTILFCLGVILNFQSFAQQNIVSLLDNPLSVVNEKRKYLDIKLDWNQEGKIQAYLNSGITELKNDNLPAAILDFDNAVKESESWIGFYYRGICHLLVGNFMHAEQDFNKVIALDSTCSEAYIELGFVFLNQKEFDKADVAFKKSIQVNPNQAYGYFGLGSIAFMKEDRNGAINHYKKSIEIASYFPESHLMIGICKFDSLKSTPELITHFNTALEIDSTYTEALFWRGFAFIEVGSFYDCLRDWQKLVQLNPENGFYKFLRGLAFVQLQDFENGFLDLRTALLFEIENENFFQAKQTILDQRIDLQYAANYLYTTGFGLKDESFGLIKKGFCQLLTGNKIGAIKSFVESNRIEKSPAALLFLGISYEHIGDHNTAYRFYDMALEIDNDIFGAHKKRGIYRYELGYWNGAYEDFQEMIRINPESLVSYRLIGLVKAHQRQYHDAIIALSTFIKSDSTDAEVFKTRGACKSYLSDFNGALADYTRALDLEKNREYFEGVISYSLILQDTVNAILTIREYQKFYGPSQFANLKMAEILIIRGQFELAKSELDNYRIKYDKSDYSGEIANLEGLMDFKKGKFHSAIIKFEFAIKRNHYNLEPVYNRAKTYLAMGNVKKAKADFTILKRKKYRDADQILQSIKSK